MTPAVFLVFWTTHTLEPTTNVDLPNIVLHSDMNVDSSFNSERLLNFLISFFMFIIYSLYLLLDLTTKKRESQGFFSLFFVYYKIPAPKFLENATFLIGYSAIFLVLVSLGVALSKLKVFSFKETLIYSLIRVLVGPIIGFAFVKYFNLTGVEAGVMFIQASMPSAVLTYLVGKMYSPKKITDSIASTVALSTFLSLFTLVFIVYFALKYFS